MEEIKAPVEDSKKVNGPKPIIEVPEVVKRDRAPSVEEVKAPIKDSE